MKKLNYKILRSGSSGNCVVVDDMIFDIGIAYRDVKDYLYKAKYLFITHRHSDHINITTLERLRREFPRIKVIGNYDVHQRFYTNEIVGDSTTINLGDRKVESFACVHDVPCHGYVVGYRDGPTLIYATDTHSLENAPTDRKYDYLFLESNHDENKIRVVQNNSKKIYGYDAWRGAVRHLSTQKSKAFYYINRRSPDSKWIELHKSERFY